MREVAMVSQVAMTSEVTTMPQVTTANKHKCHAACLARTVKPGFGA